MKKYASYLCVIIISGCATYIICNYFFERDVNEIKYQLLAESYLEMIMSSYDYKGDSKIETKILCTTFIKKESLVNQIRLIKKHSFGVKDRDVFMYDEGVIEGSFNALLKHYQTGNEKTIFDNASCYELIGVKIDYSS